VHRWGRKESEAAEQELKRRTLAIAVLGLTVLALLLVRMWQLQIVHGEEYARLADGNRLRRLATTAPRGRIL
jgi:Cell division protein FtsI/penicillin-binding protein 2